MESKLTTIYIVRHGETELNLSKYMQGQLDSPLTDTGILQAQNLSAKLRPIHFDAVFSSDLLRAKKTAELITLERNLAITTSQLLREKTYGPFEGKHYQEYEAAYKKLWKEYTSLGNSSIFHFKMGKDVESDEEAASRYMQFLREIAVSHSGKNVLVVSHGGIMKVLLIHLGYVTYEQVPPGSVGNCGYIKLEADGSDFFVQETDNIRILG